MRALLKANPNLKLSISHTSRPPRSEEVDGRDYHFVSKEIFRQKLSRGEFLESAEVYGNLYGTSQTWIDDNLSAGYDILLEIDCQGATQVREIFSACNWHLHFAAIHRGLGNTLKNTWTG